jgi:hypothetical protein
MTSTIDESIVAQSPLNADLRAGIEAISQEQIVVFTQYVQLVLPLDGFVFWVRSDLISKCSLLNKATLAKSETLPPTFNAQGSLHYTSDIQQEEDKTISINRMIFTAEQEIQPFNQLSPQILYIAAFGGEVRFAFSHRSLYRLQAGIFHYVGNAIYPDMESQIIDDVSDFDQESLVVSNSLPIWLALNSYQPPYPTFGNPTLQLYPSFIVPANITPPYGTVHIFPEGTQAIGSTLLADANSNISQLCSERVRITLFGLRNQDALNFVACVNQYSLDYDTIGMMNMPVIQDHKRTQTELSTIAMKKIVEFEISYYMSDANNIARQLILSAIPTFQLGALVAP